MTLPIECALASDTNLNECVTLAVINFQNRSHVTTAVAIVGCTKDSNHLLFLSREKKHNQSDEICKPEQEIHQKKSIKGK